MQITDEMAGRANAVAPNIPFDVVRAMLDAAMSGVGVSYADRVQIEEDVIREKFPVLMSDFVRRLRKHSIAMVYHNGHIENSPVNRTAEKVLKDVADSWHEVSDDNYANRLYDGLSGSLWDASQGFDTIAIASCR
jgi:DNA-binding transcriptional LysR family regulator